MLANNLTSPLQKSPSSELQPVIFLKEDCPIEGLNAVFPGGIPVKSTEPTLWLGETDCYEVDWAGANICEIAIALFQAKTPDSLCHAWLDRSILAIPADWVEVVL